MPAPGGNFAGARSDSRGYAGNGPSSSRSGAGGAGGVRNSSSGTRESAGSQARSSGGSTGNTSRGGNSLGGGLNGPSRSGSNGAGSSSGRPGAGSGPSRSGSNGAAGLAGAARSAFNGGSRDGGLGRVGNVGGFGRSPESLAANAQAVSRGPGLLGSLGAVRDPAAQRRALTSVGLAFGERYGLPGNTGIPAVSEMAKTLAGELGKYGQIDYDAAARTMTNRMDLMQSGTRGFGKTVKDMLGAYDANRYTSRSKVPQTVGAYGAYKAARPGVPTFNKGLVGVANAMSPYSEIEKSPVAKATHYYSGPRTKSYQAGFEKFGPHKFGNDAEMPGASTQRVASAQARSLKSSGAPNAQIAGGLPTTDQSFERQASSSRVAEFAARGKPATGASSRVAEFAARGKPSLAGSSRVAEFAARGKPAVPTSFSAGRAQEIPTPNEISRPWERAQPIPTPRERRIAGLPNPSSYSFGPGGPIRTAEPARSYAMASPNIEPASGPGFSLPGLGKINNVMQRAKASVAPLASMAWDNLNNPLLGLMRSPSRPRSRSGGDARTREVQRLVAALTGGSVAPLDFSVTET